MTWIKSLCKFLDYLLDALNCSSGGLKFNRLATQEGVEVETDITMVKFEFNQYADFTAEAYDRRGNVAGIEPGSAEWSFVGTDADGNDASDTVTITVDPTNELSARVTVGETELTGTLTLRADGDPDAGEYAPVVATADIVVDASNAVAFSLGNTTPADV